MVCSLQMPCHWFLIAGTPWLDALCLRALALDTMLDIIVFHPNGLVLYPSDKLTASAETQLYMAFPLMHDNQCYTYPMEVFARHTCFLMYDGQSHYCSAYVKDFYCTVDVHEVISRTGWRIWDCIKSAPATFESPNDSCPAGSQSPSNAGDVADTPETSAMTSAAAGLLQINGQTSPVAAQPPKRIRKPPSRYND